MSKLTFNQQGQNVEEQYNVGRDVNIDARYEENPYPEQEEFQSAGCMARGLIILGVILIVGGFLAAGGGAVMFIIRVVTTADTLLSGEIPSFSHFFSYFAIAPIGFGAFFIGMILTVIGRMMGRSAAYKNRLNNQRSSVRTQY